MASGRGLPAEWTLLSVGTAPNRSIAPGSGRPAVEPSSLPLTSRVTWGTMGGGSHGLVWGMGQNSSDGNAGLTGGGHLHVTQLGLSVPLRETEWSESASRPEAGCRLLPWVCRDGKTPRCEPTASPSSEPFPNCRWGNGGPGAVCCPGWQGLMAHAARARTTHGCFRPLSVGDACPPATRNWKKGHCESGAASLQKAAWSSPMYLRGNGGRPDLGERRFPGKPGLLRCPPRAGRGSGLRGGA